MKTAAFWSSTEQGQVQCELCPHRCRIAEGRSGRCRARGVRGGELIALSYGCISSAHLDPIEKKPLYHYRPGTEVFSIGSWGCNLSCRFCQNWTISQEAVPDGAPVLAPAAVVEAAVRAGSGGIAYTYNEPLVSIEFVLDCARLARAKGLWNVLVTNGYAEPGPAAVLMPLLDALNVDIKSMDDRFYRETCGGSLAPVLEFCRMAVEAGRHLEVTNLLIPGMNDGDEDVERLAQWAAGTLGRRTPLHLSAYHPDYRLTVPPTPGPALERALQVARRHLDYVYVGNVRSAAGSATRCPACASPLIERSGYQTRVVGLRGDACSRCGRHADVVL